MNWRILHRDVPRSGDKRCNILHNEIGPQMTPTAVACNVDHLYGLDADVVRALLR